MSVLATLGIGAGDVEVRALLIDPPDDVLAEAGGLRPRPTVASSVMVAGEARAVEEADEGAVALWVTSPEQHAG